MGVFFLTCNSNKSKGDGKRGGFLQGEGYVIACYLKVEIDIVSLMWPEGCWMFGKILIRM